MSESRRLTYDVLNPSGHHTILFLHGFMGSGRDWEVVASSMSRFRCVLVDLPGHGGSLGLGEEHYTMHGAALAVLDVLDGLSISTCDLVGYSMGGRLALFLALMAPKRWRRVVLESASPGLRTAEARAARRDVDAERAEAIVADYPAFLQRWYQQPLFASVTHYPGLCKQMIARRLANDPTELGRSLDGMGTGQQPSVWGNLPDLAVPTHAIAGALDPKYVALAHEMAACSPNLHATIVPQAGHNVHAERPGAYLTALSKLLNEK